MKKYLIGLMVGLVLAFPVGAFAWSYTQVAVPIKVTNCWQGKPDACGVEVSSFQDGEVKCYLAYQNTSDAYGRAHDSSISCVKQ